MDAILPISFGFMLARCSRFSPDTDPYANIYDEYSKVNEAKYHDGTKEAQTCKFIFRLWRNGSGLSPSWLRYRLGEQYRS